jgi:hypothetical protein
MNHHVLSVVLPDPLDQLTSRHPASPFPSSI